MFTTRLATATSAAPNHDDDQHPSGARLPTATPRAHGRPLLDDQPSAATRSAGVSKYTAVLVISVMSGTSI